MKKSSIEGVEWRSSRELSGEKGGEIEGERKRCKEGEQREQRGKLWVEGERGGKRRKKRMEERREDI